MIYLLLILDIIINNYTLYTSYFFIVYLYNKSYKYYLLTALILDFIIFHHFYNIIILSLIYLLNKLFKDLNKQNIYIYLLINTFNYIVYIILTNLIFHPSPFTILIKIGKSLIINIIFYLLMFNIRKDEHYE